MNNTTSVSAVSGVFLESRDPKKLADWYAGAFGLQFHYWPERRSYGAEFVYHDGGNPVDRKSTVFVIQPGNGKDGHGFKVQFRVDNIAGTSSSLEQSAGCKVEAREYEYGTFAQLRDPDGNLIELYEPR